MRRSGVGACLQAGDRSSGLALTASEDGQDQVACSVDGCEHPVEVVDVCEADTNDHLLLPPPPPSPPPVVEVEDDELAADVPADNEPGNVECKPRRMIPQEAIG